MADCRAHADERVEVIGTYSVWDPLPMRADNHPPAQYVRLTLADGQEGPFLGAWGHSDLLRPLDEIARFQGQRVRITGTFSLQMEQSASRHPDEAALDGPCIHPVDAIAPGVG
jgi:hypothetical protein